MRATDDPRSLYLDLMKKCLTSTIYGEPFTMVAKQRSVIKRKILDLLVSIGIRAVRPFDVTLRAEGGDQPVLAHTMIGLKRLDNLQFCVEQALFNNIPGDLIETGVWRGGASIFMRAILKAYGVTERQVWVADSFAGLPAPNPGKYPKDEGMTLHIQDYLAIPLEEVKGNFDRYGLLGEQVCFLKGWFRDTLPTLSKQRWAVIRLDGDLYESTMDGLVNLYPNLSIGGYIIIDDYGALKPCRDAVHDYRDIRSIKEQIYPIDWAGAFWRKDAGITK